MSSLFYWGFVYQFRDESGGIDCGRARAFGFTRSRARNLLCRKFAEQGYTIFEIANLRKPRSRPPGPRWYRRLRVRVLVKIAVRVSIRIGYHLFGFRGSSLPLHSSAFQFLNFSSWCLERRGYTSSHTEQSS